MVVQHTKDLNEKEVKKESPYVHRYSAYINELKYNWAYVNTKRIPGVRLKERSNATEFPSFFVQKSNANAKG
tara:strand:- start:699 stop:914 length:216 start_codon:yes stop_codon:yes gene_type:complete